ncbi:hypothetical protein GT037_001853 [Alternaria burnsii]|uniref:Uncharacterized protein n=1 Tax=Alternaria burnsii TaxID=1187904 RepID=A0A8H7BEN3_9PLEO|nr:uncharacterized protein GT037_001853 [Alternaria burnsii]KAF7680202.1 hypothetical protein GT037_001853 [Alternaria burnsii]
MYQNREEENTGFTYVLSNDETMPFRGKKSNDNQIKSFRPLAIVVVITVGYVLLGALYIRLQIQYLHLESDARIWRPELFPYTVIRVSEEDLQYYNVTSLPLADGSGFASQIFMAHELHCLKKIRQWIYKETYFEDVQGLARSELERHVNHCIETLRQGIMCRGDVSLGTYTYLSGGNDVTARSWASHRCVDFDALMEWTRSRAIDIFADGILVKPEDVGPEHITERTEPHA